MRAVVIALLLGVFIANYSDRALAGLLGIGASGWFYVLQGAWVALLCGLLLMLFANLTRGVWQRLGMAALAIGMLEALQIPACRLGVGAARADVPTGTNLCDHLFGMPVSAGLLAVEFIFLCWAVAPRRR